MLDCQDLELPLHMRLLTGHAADVYAIQSKPVMLDS